MIDLDGKDIVHVLENFEALDMAPSNAETIEHLMRFAAETIVALRKQLRAAHDQSTGARDI